MKTRNVMGDAATKQIFFMSDTPRAQAGITASSE
jgi:hypothetical protein